MDDTSAARPPLRLDPPLRRRVYDSIAETIGNTPLVRARRLIAEEGLADDLVLKGSRPCLELMEGPGQQPRLSSLRCS